MRRMLMGIAVALLLAGCATTDAVSDARGQGIKRTFRAAYPAVYQSALDAAGRRRLDIVSEDREAGRILLKSGVSWTSLGERIAVFVSRTSRRATTVEIVSKPVLSTVTFPPDWPELLFGDIEESLAGAGMTHGGMR